jgi:hypothetical protein
MQRHPTRNHGTTSSPHHECNEKGDHESPQVGFKSWPQMQCDNSRANEWGKANLMCIIEEKTSKAKWKEKG